jgi:ankyrin repeat protein
VLIYPSFICYYLFVRPRVLVFLFFRVHILVDFAGIFVRIRTEYLVRLLVIVLTEDESLLNYQNLNGWTALFWAVFVGHEKICRLLIEQYDCNVNVVDTHSWTPLHYAASKGFVEIAQLLVSNQAELNAVDNTFKWTPLIYACRNGQLKMVEYLASVGASLFEVDQDNRDGLYWACEKGHTDIAEFLVARGADINTVDISDNKTVNKLRSDSRDKEHLIEVANSALQPAIK